MKTQHQELIKKVTKMETIPFVMSGIAADSEGHVISEDGLIAMAEAIEAGETAVAELVTLKANASKLQQAATDAAAAQKTAEDALKVEQGKVATLEAKVAKLEEADGGKPSGAHGAADPKEGEEQDDLSQYETSFDKEAKQLTGA